MTVAYDPRDESQSVLEPGISMGALVPILIGCLWCLCCAGTMFFLTTRFAKQLVEVFQGPPGIRIYDQAGKLVHEKRYDGSPPVP